MKKFHAALLLLGFGFLAWLVWTIGIRVLGHQLLLLGWGLLPFILLEFVAEGIHTLGWRYCLDGPHRRLSWFRLFQIRMAGFAINYLTPTAALGGEVAKAAFLSANQPGPEAVSGVLAGKLCTGAGHLLFVIAGSVVVIGSVTLPRAVWVAMLLSGGLVGAGILAFLWLQKHGKLGGLIRWLAARKFAGQALQNAAREISAVDETLKTLYRERPQALALAVGWHVLGYSVGIVQTWWFIAFLHLPVSPLAAAGVWVLGLWFDLLTFAVPLNLGTLEGSRIVAFKAIGLGAASGMTYGVALRLAQLACAGFGLMTYAWLASQTGRSPIFSRSRAANVKTPVQSRINGISLENKP